MLEFQTFQYKYLAASKKYVYFKHNNIQLIVLVNFVLLELAYRFQTWCKDSKVQMSCNQKRATSL